MTLVLRDYQQKIIDDVIAHLKAGKKRILVVLPTGGGKTAISTELARRSLLKLKSTTFICHRRELITQTFKTFVKNDISPSFILGGKTYKKDNLTQIASINTLVNRLEIVLPPDVCFWDECHHQAASQWSKVFAEYSDKVHIGLTATPIRLDGKPLGDFYEAIVMGPSPEWLMEQGYLVKYDYYAPSVVDKTKLEVRGGEYTKASLEKANFESKIVGDNIEYYKKLANGKRNVIFARNIKQSLAIVERYKSAGIPAKHLDGDTPIKERAAAIKDFESGKILVLSNVDLFGEGFDLPSIEVVSLLTVSNSLSRVMQWWGRGLRPVYSKGFDLSKQSERLRAIETSDKQRAIILDHGSNYESHGMPDDDREWSLKGVVKRKSKSKQDDSITLKRCPNCFRTHTPAVKCPYCGHVHQADGKEIKEVEGELYLINSSEYKEAMKKQIVVAETFEQLVEIEKQMKYKNGWAENQWKYKTGENLKSTLAGCQKIADARGYKRGWAYNKFKSMQGKSSWQ